MQKYEVGSILLISFKPTASGFLFLYPIYKYIDYYFCEEIKVWHSITIFYYDDYVSSTNF